MGLGPRKSSLLERLGRPTEPGGDILWIQIDQQQRGEARAQARMRYQQKHKTPKKPEAPVAATTWKRDGERLWTWIGEPIPSKGLYPWPNPKPDDFLTELFSKYNYTSSEIRAAGFKLPRLEKKPKKGKVEK